jgi:hypothetical protein
MVSKFSIILHHLISMVISKNFILAFLFGSAALVWYFFFKKDIRPLQDNWEKAIPYQQVPEGLSGITAKDCASCHKAHYEEWKISTHAHAWTDLQFQAELKKESSPYLCINCHIPLENQQEYLVTGLEEGDVYKPVKSKNPNFDPTFQKEGISCATCHVRDGQIIGTIGSTQAPHKVKKDPEFLSEKLCISCHNASAAVTPELVCTFETGDEWKASPYFGKKNCISCHMDTVSRIIAPGTPVRVSHRHWFAGSGIPKLAGAETKGLDGMAFTESALPSKISKSDGLSYTLTLINEYAGHRLPSGDPERFYLIHLTLLSYDKKDTIASTFGRIGETWQWYPTAKKLSDNNLNPKEKRSYQLNASNLNLGNYVLRSHVTKHRMDQKTADYNKLGSNYPLFITVFEKEKELVVR